MKYTVSLFIGLLLLSASSFSQIVILKSNPSDAYGAVTTSAYPTLSGPNPTDLCGQAWTGGGSDGGWRSFFILNDSALAGIVIDSAIMQLWADPTTAWGFYGSPTYGTNNACVLYRITSSWVNTITWLSMPPHASVDSVILPQSTSTVENYLHINGTNMLNDIVSSGFNYGFMLKSRQETTPYNSMMFYSSFATDSAVRPQILVYGHTLNHSLYFTGGHSQNLNVCVNESVPVVPINALLTIVDSTTGLTDTWSFITPPSHGIAVVAYIATSTGGIITPAGLTYTPTLGYIGSDLFRVSVSNGITADTTTINVSINPYPDAGIITGTDSVCPGQTVNLSETVNDGFWSTSSFTISDVTSSGAATGLIPGHDTIVYTVENVCGIVSALFPFTVRSYAECHTGINPLSHIDNSLKIYPDPAYDELTISSANTIRSITIINTLGQTVYTNEFNSEQVTVNTKPFPTGIYYIRINASEVRKFVKE